MDKVFPLAEVAQHNNQDSCWVILYGKVYDVTQLIDNHPGGAQAILNLAGKDATEEFDPIHPRETMEALQPSLMGSLDPADRSQIMSEEASAKSMKSGNVNALLNLDDIEQAATEVASKKAWGYYYSAADDKISKNLNSAVYRSILLRPRVFVDVADCTARTSFLGHKVNLPVFVAPAAQARLGHPAGEAGIAAACRAFGVAQIISNVASQSPEEIVADAAPDQVFGWQLYI